MIDNFEGDLSVMIRKLDNLLNSYVLSVLTSGIFYGVPTL